MSEVETAGATDDRIAVASAVPADVAASIVAALADLIDPRKTETANAGTYSYAYADLAGVMAGVRPVLGQHGLAVMQPVEASKGSVTVTTRLLHKSGGFYDSPPFTLPASGSAQVIGSAVTYARRYSLLATLGLATADDDGKAASEQPHVEETAPPPPKDDPLARQVAVKFKAHGINKPKDRLAFISAALGREVTSWDELPKPDQRKVGFALDALDDVSEDDQRPELEVVASLLDGEPEP